LDGLHFVIGLLLTPLLGMFHAMIRQPYRDVRWDAVRDARQYAGARGSLGPRITVGAGWSLIIA
jgi:hypothetical protein